MKKSRLLGTVCACLFTLITTSTNAALVDNGGGLIYDDVLDITWAQPESLPYDPFPGRTWDEVNIWATALTLGGVSGWRLPYISVAAGAGPSTGGGVDCNTATELACRDNELGYMFYQNLGGTFGEAILGSSDPDLDLFPTLVPTFYWSGTAYGAFDIWGFTFVAGYVGTPLYVGNEFASWAVHAGNVVSVPAAVWLFGSGLLGLVGIARRKKAA